MSGGLLNHIPEWRFPALNPTAGRRFFFQTPQTSSSSILGPEEGAGRPPELPGERNSRPPLVPASMACPPSPQRDATVTD